MSTEMICTHCFPLPHEYLTSKNDRSLATFHLITELLASNPSRHTMQWV